MTHRKTTILASLAAVLSLAALPAQAKSVLMISIDGMNPQYVTEAQARGLSVPNLRRFMVEGSYATGVKGVTPTVSWPSATALMTGTPPARNGVLANARFEPSDRNRQAGIYYYAADIKTDTLWHAASRAGMVTANVDQLGTVGGLAVRYDIPRYEPSPWYPETLKGLESVSRPPGLLNELQAKLGVYNGIDFATEGYDTTRARFAIEILQRFKPQFMTVHLSGVDVEAHAHAPFSPQSKRAAEEIDGLIGQLRAAALANDPDAIVAIVSDHGQAPATRNFHLRIPFVEAGLIEIDPPVPGRPVRIRDWKADVWPAAGAAIMLKDPADTATRTKVREVLTRLAADPANGIARILEGAEIEALQGFTGAAFVVDMKSGTTVGADLIGAVVRDLPLPVGVHGYLPDHPEMDAAFFIAGRGVQAGRNLGRIDMLQIAPTLAQAMGVRLLDATAPVLPVFSAQP
jgi:predicted AlkP superfamily pyrophosphatase or phosphodiesterase